MKYDFPITPLPASLSKVFDSITDEGAACRYELNVEEPTIWSNGCIAAKVTLQKFVQTSQISRRGFLWLNKVRYLVWRGSWKLSTSGKCDIVRWDGKVGGSHRDDLTSKALNAGFSITPNLLDAVLGDIESRLADWHRKNKQAQAQIAIAC